VYDPTAADFWTLRIEPLSVPRVEVVRVDVDAAMRRAFDTRSDLEQVRRTLEATNINIRYFRNQTLPDISASVDYGVTGLGVARSF
jgi:outer membrane protein TolC